METRIDPTLIESNKLKWEPYINQGGVGQKGPSSSRSEGKMLPPLYMTRAQLKRHTSSLVNFSIDVHFISQKVNMPLLR